MNFQITNRTEQSSYYHMTNQILLFGHPVLLTLAGWGKNKNPSQAKEKQGHSLSFLRGNIFYIVKEKIIN